MLDDSMGLAGTPGFPSGHAARADGHRRLANVSGAEPEQR